MSELNNLYTESAIQDNLLQSYRNFQLNMQSIFIAIGTGLTITIINTNTIFEAILIIIVFLVIAILSVFSLFKFRKVILARGYDVDYWHDRIIEAEKNVSNGKKYLTRFKVYQKLHRQDIDESEFEQIIVNEEALKNLTEKGKGHTRKVIDTYLFRGFFVTWVVLLLVSLVKLLKIIL